ncbi:hypothetical protein BDN72DRAFT_956192 [Pluteus cervinus]|uniref:Uncharacterized protein n=1 Tax=Pluteus cervinus TaxID=181527 RepID=A0ACD3B843_9AGAR|nr:hypothetical protein BDN72DRAFT_956192 [Pluteus cervinus]
MIMMTNTRLHFAVLSAVVLARTAGAQDVSLTSSAAAGEPTLSSCLDNCFTEAANASGCTLFDHACICPSQAFINTTLTCLTANCPDQIAAAEGLQQEHCASIVGSSALSTLDSLAPTSGNGGATANTASTTLKPSSASQTSPAQSSQTSNGAMAKIGGGGTLDVLVAAAAVFGLAL